MTGLRFAAAEMDGATLLRTALVVNTCNAVMCRVIADNNAMGKNRWTAAGFVFGFWAVGCALLVGATRSLGDDERRR
jgi:type IV secretory pathway TrbD component